MFPRKTFRVCSVGGEIGRMKKKERKWERKWLGGGGGGGGNFGGAQEFSPQAHQNTNSPNWGENARENCANFLFDKNAHAKFHFVSAAALCFLFFF